MLVCEEVTTDSDGLFNVKRIADVYYIEEGSQTVIQALVNIKTEPEADPNREHFLEIWLYAPGGKSRRSLNPDNLPIKYLSSKRGEDIYGGVTVTVIFTLEHNMPGTYMLRVALDGQEVSKAPIMLLLSEAKDRND